MVVDRDESSFPEPGTNAGPHTLHINVLEAGFTITTDKDPRYLNEVLEQYKLAVSNTQGISGMKDPLKVAILTGFLLCDEINEQKMQAKKEQSDTEKALSRTQNLMRHLDRVIEGSHLPYD